MAPVVLTSASKSALTSFVIQPKCVVWKSDKGVSNAENLLKTHSGQAVLIEPVPPLVLKPGAGLVIDFGVKIAGWDDVRLQSGRNTIEAEADFNGRKLTDSCVWELKKTAPGGSK